MVRIRHRWSEILTVMGKSLPAGFRADRLADHQLLSDYQASVITEEEFISRLAEELHLSEVEAKQAHGLILMEDYPGAKELVDEIRAKVVDVYCLSNTNALHFSEFFSGRFPVCESFTHLLSSHIVGFNKPDAQIYRALEELSGASGNEIIFFDDLPANVEGARNVGWLAERVDPDGEPIAFIRAELSRHGLKLGQQ